MTQLEMLKVFLPEYAANEALLEVALERAKRIILNRRYPFGYPDGTELEARYQDIQLSVAVELVSRMGTEGETGRGEAGVSRSFESASVSESLLRQIVPMGRVVLKEDVSE